MVARRKPKNGISSQGLTSILVKLEGATGLSTPKGQRVDYNPNPDWARRFRWVMFGKKRIPFNAKCSQTTTSGLPLKCPKALAVLSSVTYRHPALQQKQSFLCPGGLESFHPFYMLLNGMLAAYPMDIWSLRTGVFFPQVCNIKNLVNFSKILEILVELK